MNTVLKKVFVLVCVLAFFSGLFYSETTLAQSASRRNYFSANLGVALGIGQLGADDLNLDKRTMTNVSVDGLLGFMPTENLLVGADVNYGLIQQVTNVGDVNGTNLGGQHWLAGFGVEYRFSPRWSLQTSVHVAGEYTFEKQVVANQDTKMKKPTSIKMKAQFFNRPQSALSVDVGAQFINYAEFDLAGVSTPDKASQWMMLIGMTYHFGGRTYPQDEVEVEETISEVDVIDSQVKRLSEVVKTEKTEKGFKIELKASGFKPYKSDLNDELKSKLAAIAEILKKNPKQKIKVLGYTDSTGSQKTNERVSQNRADAIRNELLKNGVSDQQVTAIGMGPSNPIADNSTKEGREQNRRIEIEVEPN